ncbi:MAG: right-handed parallel beta-helix repeat-containing protein [Thermoguttaceae bacterium]|nr:right-handed parallel beta-helix repeat-containing protein [Thermoguttaceae bacterium]
MKILLPMSYWFRFWQIRCLQTILLLGFSAMVGWGVVAAQDEQKQWAVGGVPSIGQLQAAAAQKAPYSSPNLVAVQEVESGRREVALADWWGFDPQDATAALQAAIRSKAKKVIIPKMSSAWIVDKIELVGNKEIVFEAGVEVIAKRGAFRGKSDSLFTAWNQSQLKLIGPGATLRMWRADYDQPPYEKSEWRHVLSLRGCSDVVVEGLTLAESGGDGIYLGAGRGGEPNRNITIRNVVCLNNYRQGISVITAENLLLENVLMRGTRGTPPQAGIDFEPNRPEEVLINCVLRNCRFEDNASFAIVLSLGSLNSTSRPISIRLENCITRGANAGSLAIYNRNSPEEAVRGGVEVVGCRFEDVGQARIVLQNPVGGLQVRFSRCRLADPAPQPTPPAPIVFRSEPGTDQDIGQVQFEDFVIVDPVGRMPIRFENPAGVCLKEIRGELRVQKGQQTIQYQLSPEWLNRHFPCDPIRQLPLVGLERTQVVENKVPVSMNPLRELPRHRLRGTACYLIFADQDQTVRFEWAYEQVGRYEGKPLELQIRRPDGNLLQKLELPFQQNICSDFRAPVRGVYQIVGRPGLNTLRLVRCSHPVAIGGYRGTISLFGTTGQYWFWVPAHRAVGLSVTGQSQKEMFSLELSDFQTNRILWQQQEADSPRSILLPPADKDRILRLQLLRPHQGLLEDVYIQFRGIAPLLSFQPEFLLTTEPPDMKK